MLRGRRLQISSMLKLGRELGSLAPVTGSAALEAATSPLPLRVLPAARPNLAAGWSPEEVRELLRHVATEGVVEERSQLFRLFGKAKVTSAAGTDSEDIIESDGADDAVVQCGITEFLLVAELTCAARQRDYVLLAALAERLIPEVPRASAEMLLRLATAYSTLGVINDPLFIALAASLLKVLPQPEVTAQGGLEAQFFSTDSLAKVARAYAAQRMRHEPLFDRIAQLLQAQTCGQLAPTEALSLLHSVAFLRLGEELGDLWDSLERCVVADGYEKLAPSTLVELCYILFLARRAEARLDDVAAMLDALSTPVLAADASFWSKPEGALLQHRLLLLRSALRYLHRDVYKGLSPGAAGALRRVHRLEQPQREPRPVVSFTRKLSNVLTKLRIGHFCNVERGPLLLDIVERDRKLVYECNHFDRFYSGSIDKIASMCLQERIVKAMGYRVVQVPHWQWNKIRHRRQRIEYMRMSRYYAIKDRREFGPRDEPHDDLAVSQLDHLGEYFFKKQRPSSHWSWFAPRYDAGKRLPGGGANAS